MEDKVQTQIELEQMFAKNQLLYRIKNEFKANGFEEFLAERKINVEFGLDLLVQMYLHKRTTVGVLTGILHKHFEDQDNPFQACADALYDAASKDLMDWKSVDNRFVVRYGLSDDVQKEIDTYQYPLPMIVPPNQIVNNKTTGYLTIKGSVILKNNHHDDDVVLEHLDRMNQIKLSMNPHTVRMVQNQWANLDKPKEGESYEDFKKRQRAFEKFDKTSRDVLDGLFTLGNEFYLTHKYDKRGRTYCQGYHVNIQGNDWSKGVIEFTEKEYVNDE